MKRRVLLLAFSLAAWGVVAAVLAEAFAVWRAAASLDRARAVEARLYATRAPEDAAVIERYASAPPDTDADVRAREAFLALDPAERAGFLAERGWAAFQADSAGAVVEGWAPQSPQTAPEVAEIAEKIAGAGNVLAPLPPEIVQDARAALGMAWGGARQFRDYPLPPDGGGEPRVVQFAFHPFPKDSATPEQVGVFLRASQWEKLWTTLRPNLRHADFLDLRTNSLGFRDDEVVLPKPGGVFRIVCVGGSTTAEGVTNELTWPNILEARLKASLPGRAVDVVNAGIFALGAGGEAEHLPDYMALQPDLVIHYNFVNDVPLLVEQWTNPARAGALANLRNLLGRSRFVFDYLGPLLLPNDAALDRVVDETLIAHLGRLAEACRAEAADFAPATFARPDYEHLPPDERAFYEYRVGTMLWGRLVNMAGYCRLVDAYNRRVRAFCERENLPCLDVAAAFTGGADLFTDICHLRTWGIEKKAEAFEQALLPMLAPAGESGR